MTEIIDAIDAWFTSEYASTYDTKFFGFSELVTRSNKESSYTIPMTIPGRAQVSLDDNYEFLTWIRLVNPVQYAASDDWSFGRSEARQATAQLRIVLAHKTSLGENLAFEIVRNFPSQFTVNNYQFVFVNGAPSVDVDHETIYNTELGATVYEKHRFDWNLYVLNVNIEFIECEPVGFNYIYNG